MKKDTGSSYYKISSTIEEIIMQSKKVTHSLRLALEIGDKK